MEEPRPEDIEDLLDQLEEEYGTLGPISRKVRVCPKCGKHNLEDAWHCIEWRVMTLRNPHRLPD